MKILSILSSVLHKFVPFALEIEENSVNLRSDTRQA